MVQDSEPGPTWPRLLAVVIAVVSRSSLLGNLRSFTAAVSCIALWCVTLETLADGESGPLAPDFRLPVLVNAPVESANAEIALLKLADFRNRVIYLDFWDSLCAPCRRSLPLLSALRERFSRDDFEIVAVNLDADPNDALRFLTNVQVSFPVTSDVLANVAADYGIQSLPTAFYISRDGRLAGSHVGYKSQDIRKITAKLTKLVGKPNR